MLDRHVPGTMDGPSDGCVHAELEFLGGGGAAFYYRCRTCGDALVTQGEARWTLRATAS